MRSTDAMLKQARQLAASVGTVDDRLEREWEDMCAGAKARLLAKLAQCAESPDWSPQWPSNDMDELRAILQERVEADKQQWLEQRRRGR